MLDAAALWVFLRAFNVSMEFDALIIAFGIANLLAAIPVTPGGLGYVDTGYIGMLVGFGAAAGGAALGVAAYRFAQFFFPILIGGVMYLTLRVGPWSIERRDRLMRFATWPRRSRAAARRASTSSSGSRRATTPAS